MSSSALAIVRSGIEVPQERRERRAKPPHQHSRDDEVRVGYILFEPCTVQFVLDFVQRSTCDEQESCEFLVLASESFCDIPADGVDGIVDPPRQTDAWTNRAACLDQQRSLFGPIAQPQSDQ